jgi:hypothetical protein
MIAWLIKNKRVDMFARRIVHLDKRERRRLADIFSRIVSLFQLDRNQVITLGD